MSDYTPTTEEVKESYFDWNGGNGVESPIGLYEEFDRWLAEVKTEAWENGRQSQYQEYPRMAKADNPYRQGEQQ